MVVAPPPWKAVCVFRLGQKLLVQYCSYGEKTFARQDTDAGALNSRQDYSNSVAIARQVNIAATGEERERKSADCHTLGTQGGPAYKLCNAQRLQ
jgi:hypothetical protein